MGNTLVAIKTLKAGATQKTRDRFYKTSVLAENILDKLPPRNNIYKLSYSLGT
jgi:hypothetical protein